MFDRKIIKNLQEWAKKDDRKPLILRGARQVGKTTAVNLFSKFFDQYIYLNLEKKEEREIFQNNKNVDQLINAIFFIKNIQNAKGKILLFIDEIQNSIDAISMMRYFYESNKKDFYIIGAGSLLESMIGKSQISFPVGRVEYLFMYPFCFEEFLLAMDEKKALEAYYTIPMPDYAIPKLFELFHVFALIGGMPEIINKYKQNQNITLLTPIYQGLLSSFLDDVGKYARNQSMIEILRHCIESAPLEAGKRIKFQNFGHSNYRSREVGEALRMMQRAMLIQLVYPSSSLKLPIIPDLKKSPRLQFLDTGLINYYSRLQEFFYRTNDLLSIYQGFLIEHLSGQELLSLEVEKPGRLSFWVREEKQSNAEVDFIIPYKNWVIPLEVKSGKAGLLRSLHQFMNQADHPYAIRFYYGNFDQKEVITPQGKKFTLFSLPYFLVTQIYKYLKYFLND